MAETIGSLVDKISIMDLKIFHMEEQVKRADAPLEHRQPCQTKVEILKDQRDDLVAELNGLTKDVLTGRRKLKVYRQFKMYNDPIFKIPRK